MRLMKINTNFDLIYCYSMQSEKGFDVKVVNNIWDYLSK